MDPNFESTTIIKASELSEYVKKFEVLDYKYLEAENLLITFKDNKSPKEVSESKEISRNVSVPIASAITGYARMAMTALKNSPDFTLLYSDTDSAFVNKKINPEMVGTELGKFKLVNTYKEFAAIAPKVYGGITIDDKEITKVKGLKNKISFSDLKSLLVKDSSMGVAQEKWFRQIDKSSITIRDTFYTLAVTHNKRELIYENSRLVDTKPFVIKGSGEDSSDSEHNNEDVRRPSEEDSK